MAPARFSAGLSTRASSRCSVEMYSSLSCCASRSACSRTRLRSPDRYGWGAPQGLEVALVSEIERLAKMRGAPQPYLSNVLNLVLEQAEREAQRL